MVADGGVAIAHDQQSVAAHMATDRIDLVCDLGLGPGRALVLTNDLTHAYIDENMGTS
jgi:N-acetylglutamate synthase/N-acetylornithine aminotransferase